jgi:hypothetical protein
MPASRRRTLEELLQRYRRVELVGVDLYVEGVGDKALLDYYLRSIGRGDVHVYAVDSVDVPDGKLVELGLSPGSNRNRVLALAELLRRNGVLSDTLQFLVDRDQEDLAPSGPFIENVMVTAWGSLSLGLATDASLRRIAEVHCGATSLPARVSEASFRIARHMYVLRAAAKRLDLPLSVLSPDDFIVLRAQSIDFNFRDYVSRVCIQSGSAREVDRVLAECDSCMDIVVAMELSREVTANDHDLFGVLLKLLRLHGGMTSRSVIDVRAQLRMASGPHELEAQESFHRWRLGLLDR